MSSCERPRKRSSSEALPSSVSNRYSLSTRTHGSSCLRRASSSPRRVSSFSASSSSSRAASHSLRVPVMCFVIAVLSVVRVSFIVCSLPSPHPVDVVFRYDLVVVGHESRAREVVVLARPAEVDGEHAAVLAFLADGESWSSSAFALALGTSQRTVQRALDALAAAGKVQSFGRGRARRWMIPPVPGLTTPLLLPAPLPVG